MAFRTEGAYELCGYIAISSRPPLSCSFTPGQRARRAQRISRDNGQTTAPESDIGLQGDGGG